METELLYHTVLNVIDYHTDPSGSTQYVYVLGSHGTLEAAKEFAAKSLNTLGYEPEEFEVYDVHGRGEEWKHGDGVIVYAKAPAGQEFIVRLDTTPNPEGLMVRPDGSLVLGHGLDHLHYVLQTKVDYNKDRSGAARTTEIEGCYRHRADAIRAARACLAEEREHYAQYDERTTIGLTDEVSRKMVCNT